MTVHLVNLTNPMMMKGPLREVIPVGPLTVRIRLPAGRARGAGAAADGGHDSWQRRGRRASEADGSVSRRARGHRDRHLIRRRRFRIRLNDRVFAGLAGLLSLAARSPRAGTEERQPGRRICRRTSRSSRPSASARPGRRTAGASRSCPRASATRSSSTLATRMIRLLTHYPNAGFLRVQYLPNGDFFLIGARTFTDIQTTRSRDQEMWVLKARTAGPADRARSQDLGRRRHLAAGREDRVVEHARPVSGSAGEGESVVYIADIVDDGRPAEAGEQEGGPAREAPGVHARGPGLPPERHRADLHLLPVAVCRRLRHRSAARHGDHLPQDRRRVQRGRGHLPRRRVHARRIEPRADQAELELHRHLEAEARAEQRATTCA